MLAEQPGRAKNYMAGLRRPQAARYVGVGVTKFDEMVSDGRMPKPREIGTVKVWSRIELEEAFYDLPPATDGSGNPWEQIDG